MRNRIDSFRVADIGAEVAGGGGVLPRNHSLTLPSSPAQEINHSLTLAESATSSGLNLANFWLICAPFYSFWLISAILPISATNF